MSDDRKDLPPVSSPNFLDKVREALSVYLGTRGDKLDRGITLRDLTDSGIVTLRPGFLTGGGRIPPIGGAGTAISGAYETDLTPPPTPTGFAATTSRTSIQITVGPITYTQGHGHAKTIVYGAKYLSGDPLPVFGDAVVLTEFTGDVFAFPVDPAALYRLWVKWVTVDGVVSVPAGGTNGVLAEAGLLDDANIASLTASKIRSGAISVGEYIQSANYLAGSLGWRINGAGTAEFSGVTVRGTVYASAGQIGGNTIDATGMQSTVYTAGSAGWRLNSDGSLYANNVALRGQITSGAFTGYAWPAAGNYGFYLGPSGLLLGNSNNNKYVQITYDGNLYAPGLSITNGAATFSGALSAASGTFAGSLSAATGTFNGTVSAMNGVFVDTLNVAGNAITSSTFVNGSAVGYSSSGGKIVISISLNMAVGTSSSDYSRVVYLYVFKNGVLLGSLGGAYTVSSDYIGNYSYVMVISGFIVDNSGSSGYASYQLSTVSSQVYYPWPGANILIQEAKR